MAYTGRMSPEMQTQLDAILSVPWEALEYQRWLESTKSAESTPDYLFERPVPRFEPRAEDVLAVPEDVIVLRDGGGARVRSAQLGVDVLLRGLPSAAVSRVFQAIDGKRTALEAKWASGLEPGEFERVLKAAFGGIVFAPRAVEGLERSLSSSEITRFPGSPYEIVRPYWENMIAVRAQLGTLEEGLTNATHFRRFLRELHVTALMGSELCSFYRPQSPIARKGVAPGAFLTSIPRTLETPAGTLFLEGPRVKAEPVGGALYHAVLAEKAGDPESLLPSRSVQDTSGLDWGRTVTARAEVDAQVARWFCPPRPLREGHWEALLRSLGDAWALSRARSPNTAQAVARFHYRFVRMHPFQCANQCLAMNIANFVLASAQGAGIPHLLLDHLALALTESAYTRVFNCAVQNFSTAELDVMARSQTLRDGKQRAYNAIQKMAASASVEEAARWAGENKEEAAFALIISD